MMKRTVKVIGASRSSSGFKISKSGIKIAAQIGSAAINQNPAMKGR
jgi:hypothetical protein